MDSTAGPLRRRRVVILGAAGRDFHNFNLVYRDDPGTTVVAFTAAQIPGLGPRRYPAALAGPLYPDGIAIEGEDALEAICARERVDEVIFAYSDVSHADVMHLASRALAAGADFTLLGPDRTMLEARVPVVAVCAVRTGCGKSPIARWLGRHLRRRGLRVAVLRHPMPYGDLERQVVQRFADLADLRAHGCTVEEREEYEPHLAAGNVVFAGVDYGAIVARAQEEADVLVWDGGNNDFPFVRPDLLLVVVDALRPGHATSHHPGEAVLRMADVVVVNKVDAAAPDDLERVLAEVGATNARAAVVRAASPVRLDDPSKVRGRCVLVVEDGPTLTHGGMPHGAGYAAAISAGAAEIVDPRASATAPVREMFARWPHVGRVLPAVGYSAAQLEALQQTINGADADVVVSATPIDLAALIHIDLPVVRAHYDFADDGRLKGILDAFLADKREQR